MKIWEILKEENIGNIYIDENGFKWKMDNFNLKSTKPNSNFTFNLINNHYSLYEILKIDFCEIKKPTPVTFDEILNSNKKCKVEHEMLKNIKILRDSEIKWIEDAIEIVKQGKCTYLSSLMAVLGIFMSSQQMKEIIKNGKWYLQEN